MSEFENIDDRELKLDNYFEVIATFSELLREENQALKEYDIELVKSLYERKARIVLAYRSLVAYFLKNQDFVKELSGEEKIELRDVSVELDNLLKENDLLLKARMETSKTIMDSIVNIAKVTTKANSTAYGAQGAYANLDRSRSAIAVNRTL